jgi:hypothetical protein
MVEIMDLHNSNGLSDDFQFGMTPIAFFLSLHEGPGSFCPVNTVPSPEGFFCVLEAQIMPSFRRLCQDFYTCCFPLWPHPGEYLRQCAFKPGSDGQLCVGDVELIGGLKSFSIWINIPW